MHCNLFNAFTRIAEAPTPNTQGQRAHQIVYMHVFLYFRCGRANMHIFSPLYTTSNASRTVTHYIVNSDLGGCKNGQPSFEFSGKSHKPIFKWRRQSFIANSVEWDVA